MNLILSSAIFITLLSSLIIVIRWGGLQCKGTMPTGLMAFSAILFTSGLDVGLIMFPLTEFPVYAAEAEYAFANPLAIEFGFWGFLVWAFYFLTTFYFCVVEPRLRLFEIPIVKFFNNLIIIATCAFTGYLFLSYLPNYIDGISDPLRYSLVALVVMFAVLSSLDMKYVKILSFASTWMFFLLVAVMFGMTDMGITGLGQSFGEISSYFTHIDRFVFPVSDYHAFYLFWWFSWSIMIGQFVSRFVGGLKTWQLLMALLVVPSIPIAVWFSVLYYWYGNAIEISSTLSLAMVAVGVIFVVNSLDSLIRLYTVNLNLTVTRFGKLNYVVGNWAAMFGLILLYQFTPLKIEWIGLLVIGLYLMVYILVFRGRKQLTDLSRLVGGT